MKTRFPWLPSVAATALAMTGCVTARSGEGDGFVPWWVTSGEPNSAGVIVTE